jgi:Rrf2 family protein
MTGPFKLSEATSLALHTMTFLSAVPEKTTSANEIARNLRVSEAHLAKVLQRLSKAGLLISNRGPKGGFRLAKDARDIKLREVYEVMEGRMRTKDCLYNEKICSGNGCVFHGLIGSVTKMFEQYLGSTSISDVTRTYRR